MLPQPALPFGQASFPEMRWGLQPALLWLSLPSRRLPLFKALKGSRLCAWLLPLHSEEAVMQHTACAPPQQVAQRLKCKHDAQVLAVNGHEIRTISARCEGVTGRQRLPSLQ